MENADIWTVPPWLRKAVMVVAGIETLVFVFAIALVTAKPSFNAQIMASVVLLVFFLFTLPALLLSIYDRMPVLAAILAGIAALPMVAMLALLF